MGVPDEPVAFEADDLQELRVDLEVHGAVNDVHPDLLHLPRPLDVVALVELRSELHEHGDRLPVLLGAHESFDQRRVLADPVETYLDALDVRVLGGLVDEPDDRRESLVGVVEDPVALLDSLEHVHPLGELGRHVWLERLLLELGMVQSDQLPEVSQTYGVGPVYLEVADLEVPGEQLDHIRGHGALDGHPDREPDVPVLEGLLDGGHEVAGLVDGDLHIGVPGDPERIGSLDIESGEQGRDVLLQDVLKEDVLLALGRRDANETGKGAYGNLHPRIEDIVVLVVHPHGDVQRVVRDERERMADIEGQRSEQGVDPLLVELGYPRLLVGGQVVDPVDHDACSCQSLLQTVPAAGVLVYEPAHLGGDLLHQDVVVDGCVVRTGDGVLGDYPRHADHVEFVQIAVADGEELDPLEQRVCGILRLFEAAPVEL